MKIPGQARDFERRINFEQERLVRPVERMRVHAQALIRVLGTAVILQGGVEVIVLAQNRRSSVIAYCSLSTGSTVGARWQAGDADSGVAFVAEVHANQQGGDLLDDVGVFQFSAVDAANAGNFGRQFARELGRVGIVAANNDVAVERRVGAE